MQYGNLFTSLGRVDSTNNYAMAAVQSGAAEHGMAWFSQEQFAGKGQRGKSWTGSPREAMALSIAIKPAMIYHRNPYLLSAVTALAIRRWTEEKTGIKTSVKWPNDIYCNDRKAGGILIENKYQGRDWTWAIIGIGLNINQSTFDPALPNPVSFFQLNGQTFNPELLASELHLVLMQAYDQAIANPDAIIEDLNRHLYLRNDLVRLRKEGRIYETRIKQVTLFGELVTEDSIERTFGVGEVEWVGRA